MKCLLTESTATGELWGEKMPIVLRIQKGQPALLGISSTKIIFTKWQQLFFFLVGRSTFYPDLILASGALRGLKLYLTL